jgi:hypothetical protein
MAWKLMTDDALATTSSTLWAWTGVSEAGQEKHLKREIDR